MWGLLQEKVYKTCITDLDEPKQQLRTEWVELNHVVIAEAVCGVVDSSRSVMQVLYTFLQYFLHAVINWIQI